METSDLIASFSESYTVTRSSEGTYVKGKWVNGPLQTLDIDASIQPLSGTDTMRLEEGDRTKESRKLYTATRLLTKREGATPREADTIEIDGDQFQVDSVQSWVGEYFKVIVLLRDEVAR
jgi:hypothetical protein